MARFQHEQLWPRITKLSKAAGSRRVAVAYLARGASKLLTLGEDDVLVVDMGDASVKTGRTDPQEVLSYLKKGVRVFSIENLHAKVFVLGRHVIVGSSNVSGHSRDNLVEAAIESVDPKLRASITAWIESLSIAPVTPKLAEAKLKLYKPPKWGSPSRGTPRAKPQEKRKGPRPTVGRVWIINTKPATFHADENEILDAQKASAKRMLKHPSRYWVDTIRYAAPAKFAREARPGHTVIEINRDGATIEVWPPARVVYRRAYEAGGRKRVGIHLERRSSDQAHYWRDFKNAATAGGVRVRKSSERELRNPNDHEPLLAFFRST